ncbi:MAG: redoxin domain-containing protein [Verrucomicrobiota bacterium]
MPSRDFTFPLIALVAISLHPGLLEFAHAAAPPPGHSNHGEAFNEGPRQKARLIDGVDQIISFPVTTSHPKAQRFFNQGVCQLHGFWYFEAERSFRQAAMLDPDCAMAYWGMAMANLRNADRVQGFLKKAVTLKEQVTDRERLWIEVLENYFPEDSKDKEDSRSKEEGARVFIRDIEAVSLAYPNDIEAKAFLAWAMWAKKSDVPITSYQAVDALLDQVFAVQPLHPAHHYRIHLWDGKKPAKALESAAMTGQSAPGIAHLWHMPGHTYSKMDQLDDAIWHQEASSRVDHRHMHRHLIPPYQIHNYAHNEEWLVRSYSEAGRVNDGVALARSLISIPRHPERNSLDKSGSCASYGRSRLIDLLVTWELWDELVRLSDTAWLEPASQESHQIKQHHGLAIAHYHRQEPSQLADAIKVLEQLHEEAESRRKKNAMDKAEKEKVADEKPDEYAPDGDNGKTKNTSSKGAKPSSPKSKKARQTPLSRAIAEAKVLQKILAGDPQAADALENAKSSIPTLRLTGYWLDLDDTSAATKLIEDLPNSIGGDLLRAELFLLAEKKDETRKTFERLRESAAHVDERLPATKRLVSLAEFFDVKDTWRRPAAPSKSTTSRPDQSRFGPLRWSPPKAPSWEGIGLDGKRLANHSFKKGKATLVLLYLGNQCLHCMEQVIAFAEVAKTFEDSGINIVAVSADTPERLSGALDKMPSPETLSFPILADPKLKTFRNFRAFDDFEGQPLHALALVDTEGKLRWLDTGYEPFMEADFILQESQRLLSLH